MDDFCGSLDIVVTDIIAGLSLVRARQLVSRYNDEYETSIHEKAALVDADDADLEGLRYYWKSASGPFRVL